jgi:hypothetical protein
MKINKTIKRISFIDFDATLVKSVIPEDGINKWERKSGKEFSGSKYDWWASKASLDVNIFDEIKPYKKMVHIINEDNKNDNTLTVLLTARTIKLKNEIKNILKKFNIKLDYYTFKENEETKVERIKKFIKAYPELEVINIYDDRNIEIKEFKEFRDKNKSNIKINVFKVNSGNKKLVENITYINTLIKNELLSIYNKL